MSEKRKREIDAPGRFEVRTRAKDFNRTDTSGIRFTQSVGFTDDERIVANCIERGMQVTDLDTGKVTNPLPKDDEKAAAKK